MNHKRLTLLILSLLILATIAAHQSADQIQAEVEAAYTLISSTTTAGGTAAGGAYQVTNAIGQAEAGLQTGGDYTVGGGYWGGGPVTQQRPYLFLPVLIK